MKHSLIIILIAIFGLLTPVKNVDARAYCALRDPVKAIKLLFPESAKHHSIVKAVNADVRDKLGELLPFTLHFNELGKHTLYVVSNEGQEAIGFVHVRSELTKWGLVEIAWGFKPDLTVRNVYFQRCRIPDCKGQYLTDILELTVGKSYGELLNYISPDGETLKPELAKKYDKASPFILAAIKSGLKTIMVTSTVWQMEVMKINRQLLINHNFNGVSKIALNNMSVSNERLVELEKLMGGGGSVINRESTKVFNLSQEGVDIGAIVTADWRDGDFLGTFNWLFDPEGEVLAIQPIPGWPDAEISKSFEELKGTKLNDADECHSAAELAGYELYFLSRKLK